MEIAGIIIALFIITFLREWFRVPRIEAWCRLHGLVRLEKPFRKEIEDQLKRFVEIFGPLNRAWNFGFVFTGTLSDSHFMVAEHDLKRPDGKQYWYILFALVTSGTVLGEFRLESINQTAEGFGRVIKILFFPVLLLSWALPKRKETEVLLTPVDFREDAAFDQAFKVYGDSTAAKHALTSDVRSVLVQQRWKGELAAAGDVLVWRRKGLLKPGRLDSFLPEAELIQALFLKG